MKRTFLSRTGEPLELKSSTHWRSLDEFAETDEFRELVEREFPESASMLDPVARRRFLQLMGASLGLAGVAACVSQPPEKIVPFVRQPEELIPGKPLYYATAFPFHGYGHGILVESHMGRPTKIEGNPTHPASVGATSAVAQASLLTLYDPDRSQAVRRGGRIDTYETFLAELEAAVEKQEAKQGAGLRILTRTLTSPTLGWQLERILERFPRAGWHQWEPLHRDRVLEGARQAFGEARDIYYDLEPARVIVSLDSDFLFEEPGSLAYASQFAEGRKVGRGDEMIRLYAAEPTPSISGGMADHRLRLRHGLMGSLAAELARALGLSVSGGEALPEPARAWVRAAVRDLENATHNGLVLAGPTQPPHVHAVCHLINARLGNAGRTVHSHRNSLVRHESQAASINRLASDLERGSVDLLLILEGNPVYDSPADLGLSSSLEKVAFSAHLSLFEDETSARCRWHIPAAHYLESWGDCRAFDGTASLLQPLIRPLHGGRTSLELLNALLGQVLEDPAETLRTFWSGQVGEGFEDFWRQSLHDGVVETTPGRQDRSEPDPVNQVSVPAAADGEQPYEIVFRGDPTVDDGSFANNGWLQELPKPFTRLVWGNAALVSPASARELGVDNGEVVELSTGSGQVEVPVWVLPGQADRCLTLPLGGGRTRAGKLGDNVGFNAYSLRSRAEFWRAAAGRPRPTAGRVELACTQNHHLMEARLASEEAERRHLVREGSLRHFRDHPDFVAEMSHEPPEDLSLFQAWKYEGHAWGMSIDLGACTGCNACVVGCQAENNIPVVGPEQVRAGREMHWIRVDRYFKGSLEDPAFIHQPVACQHCENAPCEIVCPVAATTHSPEGLNEMTYNRCIGTRYCSNNCPYKVRRFNFLLYQDWESPTLQLLRNPDVSVRSRGVMEKCTYCVQRINQARIQAKKENRPIADGEIVTACEAACPSRAIVFGDVNQPDSRVSRLKEDPLSYGILTDLNTRPRTSYLARIRNPGAEVEEA